MSKVTIHCDQLAYLRKIEGQIRGIQKMIEEKRYCVDILTQLHSIVGAIFHVEDNIFKNHLQGCVTQALKGKSEKEKAKKIEEVLSLVKRFRRK